MNDLDKRGIGLMDSSSYEIESFFHDNQYCSIGIYGMGYEGKKLYEELKKTDLNVLYGIDQNAMNIEIEGLEIYLPEDMHDMPKADVIVITPFRFFGAIEDAIEPFLGETDIVSLQDVRNYRYIAH